MLQPQYLQNHPCNPDKKLSFHPNIPTLASHLKQPGDEDRQADGLRDVGVVVQQRLATASHPQVQHLRLVLVVEVGRVVGELLLDAGPRREGVAAAEGDAVHQELALHVAPQAAKTHGAEAEAHFFTVLG